MIFFGLGAPFTACNIFHFTAFLAAIIFSSLAFQVYFLYGDYLFFDYLMFVSIMFLNVPFIVIVM